MASDRLIKTLKRLQPHPITLYFTWSPVRLGLVETDKRGCNADKGVLNTGREKEIYSKTQGPLLTGQVGIISRLMTLVSHQNDKYVSLFTILTVVRK
jgi:hypothetical protein